MRGFFNQPVRHRRRSMKRVKTVLMMALAVGSMAWALPAFCAGPLDGKVFEGTVGSKGEKEGKPETITFKDGKFNSSACAAYGFGDGAYTAKKRGKGIEFMADT